MIFPASQRLCCRVRRASVGYGVRDTRRPVPLLLLLPPLPPPLLRLLCYVGQSQAAGGDRAGAQEDRGGHGGLRPDLGEGVRGRDPGTPLSSSLALAL